MLQQQSRRNWPLTYAVTESPAPLPVLLLILVSDAYRAAVSLNPRDYRAWYGLGQTYELLSMPYYALHYFRSAGVGSCYYQSWRFRHQLHVMVP